MNQKVLTHLIDTTVIYARPEGTHYHLDLSCPMLINGDFEKLGYKQISKVEVKERNLKPCVCAFEDYEV